MFAFFLLCTVNLRIFFSALWIGSLDYLGCFDLRIFSDALWIQKNSQWIKKVKTRLSAGKEFKKKTILSALLQFFKTKKVLFLEKYFYFLLRNNRSIRDGAQYSKPCKKSIWQEVKITGQPGSKHDIQMEKWNSQRKTFYVRKLKEKNKFLVYLAVLHLNSVGIFSIFKELFVCIFWGFT